jgi:thioredoxin-related protein
MKQLLFGLIIGFTLAISGYYGIKAWQQSQAFNVNALPSYSQSYVHKANIQKIYKSALLNAKASNKPLLMIAGGDWCKWCGTLDNFLEEHPQLQKRFYTEYEILKVYYHKYMSKENKAFFASFPEPKGTPHFYVINSQDGTLMYSYSTKAIERGYSYNLKKFNTFLDSHKIYK